MPGIPDGGSATAMGACNSHGVFLTSQWNQEVLVSIVAFVWRRSSCSSPSRPTHLTKITLKHSRIATMDTLSQPHSERIKNSETKGLTDGSNISKVDEETARTEN
jgi:hypothetical protein